MKIFIWGDAFCNYTRGTVIVSAKTLKEAFALMGEYAGYPPADLEGIPPDKIIDGEKGKRPFRVRAAGGG